MERTTKLVATLDDHKIFIRTLSPRTHPRLRTINARQTELVLYAQRINERLRKIESKLTFGIGSRVVDRRHVTRAINPLQEHLDILHHIFRLNT